MKKSFLNIIDGQGSLERICLDNFTGNEITIGHKETCNVVLKENYVSREHAVLFKDSHGYYYQNLSTTNGSHVETGYFSGHLRDKSEMLPLEDNSLIKIGSINNPDRQILLWFTLMDEDESLTILSMQKEAITIGRTVENDIVLENPNIARCHAIVRRTAQGNIITDCSKSSGLFINGNRVSGNAYLKEKDAIQILGFNLIYSRNQFFYKKKTSGIYIKTISVEKIVDKNNRILTDVNLEIKGNEFVAIVGGSGAGKSTLMGVLSGFDRKFSGDVLYNNISVRRHFNSLKDMIGYVPQEDIIFENLTLGEMLRYTAELRMPADQTDEEISLRIDEVLATLDLSEHKDKFIRKLSGGQKKRASIAVELLADPQVFFLDEPTSGLDPGTEKNLMLSLRKLSREQERTIILVTHTTQSLHLCDKVIFMGPGGILCYCGSVDDAKSFFGTSDLNDIYNIISADPISWAELYKQKASQRISHQADVETFTPEKPNRVSALYQFAVILERYVALCLHDWRKMMIQLVTPLIMGIIIWFITDSDFLKRYSETKSIMFTISCAAIWIGLFAAIQEICKERAILKREYMTNLRLRSYVGAKFFVLSIQGAVQTVIMIAVAFIGLKYKFSGDDEIELVANHTLFGNNKNITGEVLITVWLTVLASIALGLLISSLVRNSDKATTFAPFVLIIQLVFSGMLFELEGAKETISYITFSRWSVDALGRIANIRSYDNFPTGRDQNMFSWSSDGLIMDWTILICMAAICLIACVVILRNVSRDGR